MGNTLSEDIEKRDVWWKNQDLVSENSHNSSQNNVLEAECSQNFYRNDTESRQKYRAAKLDEFKTELAQKHLARRQAIAERSKEILNLREELEKNKKENDFLRLELSKQNQKHESLTEIEDTSWNEKIIRNLRSENENLQIEIQQKNEELSKFREISQNNHELRTNIAEIQEELQHANSQIVNFEQEKLDYQTHVVAMKEVVKVTKQLLEIREKQLEELRSKVTEIQTAVTEQETSLLSTNLRSEYEKQLRNMRALRALYDQKQAALKAEKDALSTELDETNKKLKSEQKTNTELQERIEELETNISEKYDKISNLESKLGFSKAECRGLQAEMLVINQLFSQILIGFNNGHLDLDKLILLLEENHDLLTDIVINEESMEHISALPKTLLDLIDQVHNKNQQNIEKEENGLEKVENEENLQENEGSQADQQGASSNQVCSAAEIVHNLPKVWRVLAELLSQQSGQQPVSIPEEGETDPCYKSIETPKGPQLVLSVSQTFIRLKDLILEKKSLEKEMTRLKQLNTHLEVRLQDQEKRLETVSSELSKTWHVVGRMQRQHQQLHTHEKILRYELSQKRKMLSELKEELEYCREKWVQAREKNSCTEQQWKQLRSEFALRKVTTVDDLNNSGESGYSDERECSSDEEFSSTETKTAPKNISSEDENETDTHGSDGEDFLETAFNKACSSKPLAQPNFQLPSTIFLTNKTDCETEKTVILNTERKTEHIQNNLVISESTSNQNQNKNSLEKTKDFFLYKIITNLEEKEPKQSPEINFENIDFSQIEIPQNEALSSTNLKELEVNLPKIDEVPLIDFQTNLTSNLPSTSSDASSKCQESVNFYQIEVPPNENQTNEVGFDVLHIPQTEVPLKCEENTDFDLLNPQNTEQKSLEESNEHKVQVLEQILDQTSLLQPTIEVQSTSEVFPSTSTETSRSTCEEILSRREARLRRLEEQCQQLVTKVTNTTNRGAAISSRLTMLHEQYGSSTENQSTNNEVHDVKEVEEETEAQDNEEN